MTVTKEDKPPVHAESARARAFCRKLVKAEARNFYYGFLLLPTRKRRAVYALYTFCRILDDALDDASPTGEDRVRLKGRFNRMIAGDTTIREEADRFSTIALREARDEYPISARQLNWIMEGVLMDCDYSRYPTVEDLRRYLFGVASAVGLACIEIFRYRRPAARAYAVFLGYGMQLTNIIRDVKEDYLRGRIYLPLEDLNRFEVAESDLGADVTPPQVRRLLAFETERARRWFRKAEGLWPLLDRDAVPCPYALSLIYRALLRTIERHDFAVLEKRRSLPAWQKLYLMTRAAVAFR